MPADPFFRSINCEPARPLSVAQSSTLDGSTQLNPVGGTSLFFLTLNIFPSFGPSTANSVRLVYGKDPKFLPLTQLQSMFRRPNSLISWRSRQKIRIWCLLNFMTVAQDPYNLHQRQHRTKKLELVKTYFTLKTHLRHSLGNREALGSFKFQCPSYQYMIHDIKPKVITPGKAESCLGVSSNMDTYFVLLSTCVYLAAV